MSLQESKKPEIGHGNAETKTTEYRLVEIFYEYATENLKGVSLVLPTVELCETNPRYRHREHKMYLPLDNDGNVNIAEVAEEVAHSVVAQMPNRIKSLEQIKEWAQKTQEMPNNTSFDRLLRLRSFVEDCDMEVRWGNSEEFLARYSVYCFLNDQEYSQRIATILNLSVDEVKKSSENLLEVGLKLKPNYEEGYSNLWNYAWSYLYASSLFMTTGKPKLNELLNLTDGQIWFMAKEHFNDLRWEPKRVGSNLNEEQIERVLKGYKLFEFFRNKYLNKDFAERFKVARKPSVGVIE